MNEVEQETMLRLRKHVYEMRNTERKYYDRNSDHLKGYDSACRQMIDYIKTRT